MTLPLRLVVPLDGSPQANAGLPLVTGLARTLAVPVLLLRAVRAPAETKVADQQLAGVAHEIGRNDVSVQSRVLVGDPVQAVLGALAPDDLVVLGLSRRADFGRLTHALLQEWSGPVVLRRAGGRRVLKVRSIGACGSDEAVRYGSSLARRLGLELCLLATVDPLCLNAVDLVSADREHAPLALDATYETPLLVGGNA